MNFNVVVVGSGLAGLIVALHLAGHRHVVVTSKRGLPGGANDQTRGGITAVLDSDNSHNEHVDDMSIAGARLCGETAARYIIENECPTIKRLIDHGMSFTRDEQAKLGFYLTHEGDHRHRRITHAVDATGHAVIMTLIEKMHNHPNVTLLEDHFAIDLITDAGLGRPGMRCHDLYALDTASDCVKTVTAS